jgi:nicotinate-nucleotide adenylyltransferase
MSTTTLGNGIGILGGTFDPIHIGHTQSALAVAKELELTTILLIPAHIPPHKTSSDLMPHATADQRAAMVELACQKSPLLSCDTRELLRDGHSYTVDTLKELKLEYPKQPLYFIIGMDSLMSFTRWFQYKEILNLCHLVVNTRPNYPFEQITHETIALLNTYQTTDITQLSKLDSGTIFLAKAQFFDISSTQIRHDLARNQTTHQYLSPKISDFIHKNNLYR